MEKWDTPGIKLIRLGRNWVTEHMGSKNSPGANRLQGGDKRGRRREGAGTGGAWRDPGHSHYGGPWWSRRREEPWRRNGHRLQGADQQWRSRWKKSLRQRRRAKEQGRRGGSGGPRQNRWCRQPTQRCGFREATVELEQHRTEEEPRGWRSLTEPEEGRDEAKPEAWSPVVQDGRRQTKAEPEGWGSPAELVDCRATVKRKELGAMVEPTGWGGVRASEAGGRVEGKSDHALEELAPHRWWAEGEQRVCQMTEEAGFH